MRTLKRELRRQQHQALFFCPSFWSFFAFFPFQPRENFASKEGGGVGWFERHARAEPLFSLSLFLFLPPSLYNRRRMVFTLARKRVAWPPPTSSSKNPTARDVIYIHTSTHTHTHNHNQILDHTTGVLRAAIIVQSVLSSCDSVLGRGLARRVSRSDCFDLVWLTVTHTNTICLFLEKKRLRFCCLGCFRV